MFVIKMSSDIGKNVTDKIYRDMVKYDISSNIVLIYEVGMGFDKNINASCYLIDAENIKDMEEEEIEDLVLDVADKKSTIIIKNIVGDCEIKELLDYYGINYFAEEDMEFRVDLNIDNLGKKDLEYINCIVESKGMGFDFNNIYFRFDVDSLGNIECKETKNKFNIFENDIVKIYENCNELEEVNNKLCDLDLKVDTSINNILPFLFKEYKKSELLRYKLGIYKIISELTPENYSKIYKHCDRFLLNFINSKDLNKILNSIK